MTTRGKCIDPDFLVQCAERWRRMAGQWNELAKDVPHERAVRLRRAGARALYAAYEAERLLGIDALSRAGVTPLAITVRLLPPD